MTNRPVHFEIHAADPARARDFYAEVFGWTFQDWSEYTGMPYFGATTGSAPQDPVERAHETPAGIDGAIMQRQGPDPAPGSPVAGAVLTLGVEDLDAILERAVAAGATIAMSKYALPGMAWQAYVLDPAGNVLGLHQPDPDAA